MKSMIRELWWAATILVCSAMPVAAASEDSAAATKPAAASSAASKSPDDATASAKAAESPSKAKALKEAEDDGKPKGITFDDLKFDIEKGTPFERKMLTDRIEELEGRRVRLRGYMLPSFQQKGIRQFVLVRDNQECCFGPGAALYDCVVIELQRGKSTQYTVRPVTVEGVFKVNELKAPDGTHLAVFEMQGETVK